MSTQYNKDKLFVDSIINTYLSRLTELSNDTARHFVYRAYLATGDAKLHEKLIDTYLPQSISESKKYIDKYNNDFNELKKRKIELIEKSNPHKITEGKRKKWWLKHPNIYLASGLLWPVYYVSKFGGDKDSLIKQIDRKEFQKVFDEMFDNPEFIKYAVVRATNLTYLSVDLGLSDYEDRFIKAFQDVFSQDVKYMDDVDFTNYIYGLTHIIIGNTGFYEREPDNNKLNWISKELVLLENDIFSRLSLDVNTETALCMRLLGIKNTPYIEKVMQRVKESFSEKLGFIKREDKNSFRFAEHTNAIALLLFNFDQYKTLVKS